MLSCVDRPVVLEWVSPVPLPLPHSSVGRAFSAVGELSEVVDSAPKVTDRLNAQPKAGARKAAFFPRLCLPRTPLRSNQYPHR